MQKLNLWRPLLTVALVVCIAALVPTAAYGAGVITVKTVPWVASNPLIPHDTWSGATITLKGTADQSGGNVIYTWDFGDGSQLATGSVGDPYAIEALHVYNGTIGTIFTARLTVTNMSTGDTGNQAYFVAIRSKQLGVEVNRAIDEGLWYAHKNLSRYTDAYGQPAGDWVYQLGYYGLQPAYIQAFEVNGHLASGDPSNPYTETVSRAMRTMFTYLVTSPITGSTSGTGYGVFVNQSNAFYQGGMFMDAIVASTTPNAIAPTGNSGGGGDPGIKGRTYRAIVWDMLDAYGYCQYKDPNYGGWRYNCQEFPDNSVSQWAAIGMLAAEHTSAWQIPIPSAIKASNLNWLTYSQNPNTGWFGYTDPNPIWGPYATTPSGMVQLIMDDKGRGYPAWDKAETFMRNNWDDQGGFGYPVKTYYYGLFSFTKAMFLHNPPIHLLHSTTPNVPDLDWYLAETANGDPSNGVARTLVNDQSTNGQWWGHNVNYYQYFFETPWALIMLNKTLFTGGQPVAVATATPNPALAGQTITLDGSQSYQQDQTKQIVKWEWDTNNDGVYELTGVKVTTSYPSLGTYPVTLRVTDNNYPPQTATTTIQVLVTIPPVPPTANANGPYTFCPGKSWFLDGSKSVNPDDGKHEPGCPGDFIKSYAWDLHGQGTFTDAFGAQPDVTGDWGPGSYLVQLKVTDNTALSFPSSHLGDLSSTASTQVVVKASCTCVSDLKAIAKSKQIQLTWTNTYADHYNVYRGTVKGGPYPTLIKTIAGGSMTRLGFIDTGLTNNVTYYYVVKDANAQGVEYCVSNEASGKPVSLF